MSYAEVDRVAKQIPQTLDMTLAKALEENPALGEMQRTTPQVQELLDVAQRLEGVTRHASVHAAGVVIAPAPITEFAPLYKKDDIVTTQWAMNEVERIGPSQDGFPRPQHADAAARRGGSHPALDRRDDPAGCDSARRREGLPAVRQRADARHLPVRELRHARDAAQGQAAAVEDLIALNALYRPGPLGAGVIDTFIDRKDGKEEIAYDTPKLEPILHGTYGVIAYQEQVMRIASDLAGFTMGEADVLRKAMGKKIASVMEAQREKFLTGAVERGLAAEVARKIWDLMEYFAGYGFNKSHSAAYALLAYQTAYLKANHPACFMAALLTIERQNTDKVSLYLGECRDLGVRVLPPDVNESEWAFTVTPAGVRFGLGAIKNVGDGAVESILAARRESGRLTSLNRLCEDVDLRLVNKRVLESLVKAGAFDGLGGDDAASGNGAGRRRRSAQLLAAVDGAIEHGSRRQKNRDRGQHELFGESEALQADGTAMRLPDVPRVDRGRAARVREGGARPVPQRPSHRSVFAGSSTGPVCGR